MLPDAPAPAVIQTFLPLGRRRSLASGVPLPEQASGTALFADISGFTPLTESLGASLGPQKGAEALTAVINEVFEALIAQVHHYGGDVLGFAGDAIVCWFPGLSSPPLPLLPSPVGEGRRDGGRGEVRALAAALAMQEQMARFAAVPTPDGRTHALSMRAGLAHGPVRRFTAGAPEYGLFEILTGATVDRMAAAEHLAERGEVICAPEIPALLDGAAVTWEESRDGFRRLLSLDPAAVETPPAAEVPDLPIEALRPYFPPALFDWLTAAGEHFLGELRPVVSAFVRFEGLDYEGDPAAGEKLNQYVTTAQRTATRYGGSVIRLDYGDKGSVLHVVFGAPVAHEDDEARAVGWALELQAAVREQPFITGQYVGMTKGQVYAGALGASTRRGYTLMGDEVNASARLMQACQSGQILVSQRIMQAAQKRYMFHQFPGFQVKGKYVPVPVAMPVAALPPVQLMVPAGPLVGREQEMEQLDGALESLLAGTGGTVRIEGGEGVGKSRLAAELVQRAMARGVRTLVGNAQSIGQATPYLPWREVFRTLFGLQSAWPAAQQAMQIQTMVQWINPAWLPRVPLLGDVLGLEIPDTPTTAAFDPRFRQQSLFALVGDLLVQMSTQQPLLVLIEDCHWADENSLALVESLGLNLATARVLLVVTQRPAADLGRPLLPALDSGERYSPMRLAELPPEAVRTLVTGRLGGELPPDILALIQERAQGNPLFVEELAETLRETGHLQQQAGRWLLVGVESSALRLPDTVQGVVLARLDVLDEPSKLTLRVASVVGRAFEVRVVQQVHPTGPAAEVLEEQLRGLERRDIILEEASEPVRLCRFKHNVMQEVAYETLLHVQRRALHRAVAAWYESSQQAALAPYYPLLAHHYHHAEDLGRERHYASLAGEQAAAHFANTEALRYLGRALELTPAEEPAERYALLLAREKVYDLQGERDPQARDLQALQELAEALDDNRRRVEVMLRRAHYAEVTGDCPAASAHAEAAIALAQAAQDAGGEAAGHLQWGRVLWIQGALAEARSRLEQARALAQEAGRRREEGDSLRNLGIVAMKQGDYAGSSAYHEQALVIYREVGDLRSEGATLSNLGDVAAEQGDHAGSSAYYEQSMRIQRQIGDRQREGLAFNNIGLNFQEQGDYAAAQAYYQQALAIFIKIADPLGQLMTYSNLGFAALNQGDYGGARARFERALQLCRELGDRRDEAIVLSNLGLLSHHLGDDVAAGEYCRQALQTAQEVGDRPTQGEALTHLGHALAGLGWLEEAAATFRQAVEMRRELGEPHLAMESLAGLAQACLAQEDIPQARAAVEEILGHLDGGGTLHGTEEPFRIYLTCFHVLQAVQDPRADEILATAYSLLQQWGGRISDEAARRSFLENVVAHRQIVAAFAQAQAALPAVPEPSPAAIPLPALEVPPSPVVEAPAEGDTIGKKRKKKAIEKEREIEKERKREGKKGKKEKKGKKGKKKEREKKAKKQKEKGREKKKEKRGKV